MKKVTLVQVYVEVNADHQRFAVSFFFQAEDGIRDGRVTGVQTCALPISLLGLLGILAGDKRAGREGGAHAVAAIGADLTVGPFLEAAREVVAGARPGVRDRSEERRVGKECRSRGAAGHSKERQRIGDYES